MPLPTAQQIADTLRTGFAILDALSGTLHVARHDRKLVYTALDALSPAPRTCVLCTDQRARPHDAPYERRLLVQTNGIQALNAICPSTIPPIQPRRSALAQRPKRLTFPACHMPAPAACSTKNHSPPEPLA